MEIDLSKLPEQISISRDMAINTVILMQNLKALVPSLINVLPTEMLVQLPATAGLIMAWDRLADEAISEIGRQEAVALYRQAGIKL